MGERDGGRASHGERCNESSLIPFWNIKKALKHKDETLWTQWTVLYLTTEHAFYIMNLMGKGDLYERREKNVWKKIY